MKSLVFLHTVANFNNYLDIDKNFYKNPFVKIYAFTIEIRLFLKGKNIQFSIQEQIIPEHLDKLIDDKAYYFSRKWHNNLFKYKGISLGLIIERIFFYYFSKNLKNLQIFLNLIEIEKPTEIIAFEHKDPHLKEFNEVLKYICSIKRISLKIIPIPELKSSSRIKLNQKTKRKSQSIISFLGKSIAIKYSMKVLSNCIWALKDLKMKVFKNTKKTILMYGYSYHLPVVKTILQNKNYNLVLLDDRPNILKNRDFFHIFLNKNGAYYKFFEFYESFIINKKAKKDFNKLLVKWKKTIENPKFQEKFSFNNIAFWEIIKKQILITFNLEFKRIIKTILISYKILTKNNYDLIIFETDSREGDRVVSIVAHNLNIPTLVIQHGLTGHQSTFVPTVCDKLAVWGKISREELKKFGVSENKLEITGSPRFDDYFYYLKNKNLIEETKNKIFQKFNIAKGKRLIVLATIHNHFYKIAASIDFNHLEIEQMYTMAIRAAKDLSNSHLIIKLHPHDENSHLPLIIQKKFGIENVSITADYNIVDLIVSCDLFLTGYSTTILEALILKKPIIIINFRDSMNIVPALNNDVVFRTSNYEQLIIKIKELINNHDSLKNYDKFLEDYLYKIDGQSTKRVSKLIEDIIFKK